LSDSAPWAAAALNWRACKSPRCFSIDPKRFKPESILTQPIGPEAIGCLKAFHIGELCKAISPETQIFCYEGGIEDIHLDCLTGIDAFLSRDRQFAGGSGNRRNSPPPGDSSCARFRPRETLVAQVRTFAHRDGAGPCLACGYDKIEWLHMAEGIVYTCDPASAAERTIHTQPTFSLVSLCSLAADLMVMTLLKLMIGFGA